MKMYIPVEGSEKVNFIKVHTFYDLGGINAFTGRPQQRGFYVSCTPVFREPKYGCMMESTVLGSGYKQLCVAVSNRRTKKAEAEAEKVAEELYDAIVQRICREEGLTIKEGVA